MGEKYQEKHCKRIVKTIELLKLCKTYPYIRNARGLNSNQIAKEMKINRETVESLILSNESLLRIRNEIKKRNIDKRNEGIKRLLCSGHGYKEIANRFKISFSVVSEIKKKMTNEELWLRKQFKKKLK